MESFGFVYIDTGSEFRAPFLSLDLRFPEIQMLSKNMWLALKTEYKKKRTKDVILFFLCVNPQYI